MKVMLVKMLAFVAGAAILAATAHVTVTTYAGGYSNPYAALVLTLAVGLCAGSLAVGIALRAGRYPLACYLVLAMLSAELFGLLQTCNRIAAALEANQAPLRTAIEVRSKVRTRLEAAKSAVEHLPQSSPDIEQALKEKAAVDQAVLTKADTKGCAANCRALLEQQTAEASATVERARAALRQRNERATEELKAAQAAYAALPADASATPFADKLGVPAWMLDVAAAVFGSLGANGLAAGLIAFAGHGSAQHPAPQAPQPAPVLVQAVPPNDRRKREKKTTELIALPSPREHAAKFGVSCFKADPQGELPIIQMHGRYRLWCNENGLSPLPPDKIAGELRQLFDKAGLLIEERGKDLVVKGLRLA